MYEENSEQGGRPSGATCVSGVGWPELASGRGKFWAVYRRLVTRRGERGRSVSSFILPTLERQLTETHVHIEYAVAS